MKTMEVTYDSYLLARSIFMDTLTSIAAYGIQILNY